MSVDSYRRAVENHRREIGRLQEKKSQESLNAVRERKKALDASQAASRITSASSRESKLRDVQRYEESAARHEKKAADIEKEIAREYGRFNDASRRLESAQKQQLEQNVRDQERSSREADQRLRRTIQEQERASQEAEQRFGSISSKLNQHDQLHEVAMSAIEKLQQLPEQISVLFFASNPLDTAALRLDEEARAINDMIRKAKHRDAIRFETRWAVRPQDLLQAINEHEPTIIHFSGHGSDQDQIVFQNDAGQTRLVSKEAIVQTMAASSEKIQLVFFNTCYSRLQAEAVVKTIPAAIGMNTSIGDDAARVFSAQFYSSIGFGQSIHQAFQQARVALLLESIPEDSTPELFVSEGLDAKSLVLVKPPSTAG